MVNKNKCHPQNKEYIEMSCMKDATNAMRNLCDRRQSCDELINRRLFNRSKWLTNHRCPEDHYLNPFKDVQESLACENNHLMIYCPDYHYLNLVSVVFGRVEIDKCMTKSDTPISSQEFSPCGSDTKKIWEIVGKKCQGEEWCRIKASRDTLNSWTIRAHGGTATACYNNAKQIKCNRREMSITVINSYFARFTESDPFCEPKGIKNFYKPCQANSNFTLMKINELCSMKSTCGLENFGEFDKGFPEFSMHKFRKCTIRDKPFLTVDYLCSYVFMLNICFNKVRKVKCPKDQVIRLNFATFGRHRLKTCNPYENLAQDLQDYEDLSIFERHCETNTTEISQIVSEQCEGKNSCVLKASLNEYSRNNILGRDHKKCTSAIRPYLFVKYTCESF
ncbi:DgyrCDS6211 [Dimorphilus gyrociliatus]|uniref:DgyrCDS6211 n=1 Tax=Dimorphilus gyrociliatus TaxID=2664684 RepID=A0A7I8VME1_9ANNE|nr:DgyrCDS6211 [Dimorphilus gyrociliatus]